MFKKYLLLEVLFKCRVDNYVILLLLSLTDFECGPWLSRRMSVNDIFVPICLLSLSYLFLSDLSVFHY